MRTLKACLNGGRPRLAHPAVPVTPADLAAAAAGAVAAGATALHVHPRGPDGRESMAPDDVAAALEAIRVRAPGIPVGVTTAAWVEPDRDRRLALVSAWEVRPDFASVNFREHGAVELSRLLLDAGIGVEAGLWTVPDVRALLASGLTTACVRLLLEPTEPEPAAAIANATAMRDALGDAAGGVPVLLHGEGAAAWPVLTEAVRLGLDIRIGLEDCLTLPSGEPAPDNATLVAAAARCIAAEGRASRRSPS